MKDVVVRQVHALSSVPDGRQTNGLAHACGGQPRPRRPSLEQRHRPRLEPGLDIGQKQVGVSTKAGRA